MAIYLDRYIGKISRKIYASLFTGLISRSEIMFISPLCSFIHLLHLEQLVFITLIIRKKCCFTNTIK